MADKKTKPAGGGYIATVGIDHKDTRIEPGDPVKGLPDTVVKALLKQGVIKKAGK